MNYTTRDYSLDMSFSLGFSDDETPEEVFLQNIRFAEWLHRTRSRERNVALHVRLSSLFSGLPQEARSTITDDEHALIRDIVQARNSLIHALEGAEGRRATGFRLKSITTKLGVLLYIHFGLMDFGVDVAEAVGRFQKNRTLMKYLLMTDRVDDRQRRLPGF